MKTRVVNLRKKEYDVYIGRGSRWGNPFVIGIDGNREEVISKCEDWIMGVIQVSKTKCDAAKVPYNPPTMEEIKQLHGKTLGCFCKPLACHGDIYVRLAKGKENV